MNMRVNYAVLAAGWFCLTGFAAEEDVIRKSFDVKAGDNLYMRVDRGTIKVTRSEGEKVDIQVVRELLRGTEEAAKEAYEKHEIEIAQDGDTVRIEAENQAGFLDNVRNAFRNLRVEYTVAVPARFDLDLRTAGGNIEVTEIEGEVKVQTSGGNLKLGTIQGPLNGRTSGGSIEWAGGGEKADLHTSGGNIRIGEFKGDLVAKTSGGSIQVKTLSGNAEVSTSGGNIRMNHVEGSVQARTSGGSIQAGIEKQLTGDSSLKTSGGNIDVTLGQKTGAMVRAKTSGGRVQTDFEGEFNKQRSSFSGEVNGGGPELSLATSGGSIKIGQ